jgi:phage baseplate assembly protein W
MQLDYPYHFDGRHRTGETTEEAHVRDMIEQVLFTVPGERVNRPDFGSGLLQLVFAGNSPELATATGLLAQGALQRWLGEAIEVDAVDVEAVDSSLFVTVRYCLRRSQQPRVAQFQRALP